MKRKLMIRIMVILLGASLLAACGQAALPNANPNLPAVNAPASAATAAPLAAATVASVPAATSKPSGASSADACVFLTNADVNQVLGQTFVPVAGTGKYGVCAYTFNLSRIDLTIANTGATQSMKITRTNLAEMALDVPGLGDEAFYNTNSSALFVRKGDAMYMMSYLDSMVTQPDKIAKETILAGLLLSRLS